MTASRIVAEINGSNNPNVLEGHLRTLISEVGRNIQGLAAIQQSIDFRTNNRFTPYLNSVGIDFIGINQALEESRQTLKDWETQQNGKCSAETINTLRSYIDYLQYGAPKPNLSISRTIVITPKLVELIARLNPLENNILNIFASYAPLVANIPRIEATLIRCVENPFIAQAKLLSDNKASLAEKIKSINKKSAGANAGAIITFENDPEKRYMLKLEKLPDIIKTRAAFHLYKLYAPLTPDVHVRSANPALIDAINFSFMQNELYTPSLNTLRDVRAFHQAPAKKSKIPIFKKTNVAFADAVYTPMVVGFENFGEDFLERRGVADGKNLYRVPEMFNGKPIRNFMQIAAVAKILGDSDWLGAQGANTGFVKSENHLEAVIVDGAAFTLLEQENSYLLKNKDIIFANANRNAVISWYALSPDQQEAFIAVLDEFSRKSTSELEKLMFAGMKTNCKLLEAVKNNIELQCRVYEDELLKYRSKQMASNPDQTFYQLINELDAHKPKNIFLPDHLESFIEIAPAFYRTLCAHEDRILMLNTTNTLLRLCLVDEAIINGDPINKAQEREEALENLKKCFDQMSLKPAFAAPANLPLVQESVASLKKLSMAALVGSIFLAAVGASFVAAGLVLMPASFGASAVLLAIAVPFFIASAAYGGVAAYQLLTRKLASPILFSGKVNLLHQGFFHAKPNPKPSIDEQKANAQIATLLGRLKH